MGVIHFSYQDGFDFRIAINQIQLTNPPTSLSPSVICRSTNCCMSLAGKGMIFPLQVYFKLAWNVLFTLQLKQELIQKIN